MVNSKIRKIVLGVMFILPGLSVAIAQQTAEAPAVESAPAENTRQITMYKDPSLPLLILQSENKVELRNITESFLEVTYAYDRISPETLINSIDAYLDALVNVNERMEKVGFRAILDDRTPDLELEQEFKSLKNEALQVMSAEVLMLYLSQQEVLHSSRVLKRLVNSGELSVENQRMLLDGVVNIHFKTQQNIGRFLLENVVRPILSKSKTLQAEYIEKFGVDLMTESLFSRAELQSALAANVVRISERSKKTKTERHVDLVEAREGVVSGKVERDPKKEKERTRRQQQRQARRRARSR